MHIYVFVYKKWWLYSGKVTEKKDVIRWITNRIPILKWIMK